MSKNKLKSKIDTNSLPKLDKNLFKLETLFYRNMALMQKALFFASTLNKGSNGCNGFGHNIVVDDFFEQEGREPLRKKARVVKSVPLATGKKPPYSH